MMRGYIFDLDGVIVDTAKYHFKAWQSLAKKVGVSFDEAQNEQLKGVSRVKSLEKILAWGNTTVSDDEFVSLMASKNEEYLEFIAEMDESEILPNVTEILQLLKSKGHPIALGSASKNAKIILERVNLLHMFDVLVDGNSVTTAKPDPEVFLKAAQGLGVKPDDCVVFEDSVAGVQAANTGGMISVGVGSPDVLSEADVVVKDFTELNEQFLENLRK
ncbi:MAG: beta-phosphoglucomutase [Bacteroidetes bacterium MedPE-SWsnd-G2]|nr:MAG: beta-phosphoglucomutase [Bacteroidetes bacterium MedPE-SWsnd-G2]